MITRSGVRLGDLAQFKYGNMPDTEMVVASPDENHPYPAYSGYRVVGFYPRYNYFEPTLIIVCRGVGGTGDVKISPPKCWLTNLSISFRFTDKEVSAKYLYYLFKVYSLRFLDTGSAQSQITIADLKRLKIDLPSYFTQRKIAAILTAYDDLIEVNKRRIALLEKMAEELYREWFVRMRFPGHQDTRFVKGVPEGWSETQLGKIARFTMGQSPKSEFYNEIGEGLPFHQGVGTYGDRFPNTSTYCSVDGRRAFMGDILFSVRAPVGRLNIADCDMIIGRGLAAIKHVDSKNSYLYYLLKTVFANEDIIGNGSIFNSVGKDELARFGVHGHPMSLVQKFDDIARPIDQQIERLIRSKAILTKTRDLLLPRLISGKLSVENLDIQFPPSMQQDASAAAVETEVRG